jgi:Ca2+-binding EF-hand superfamily protein
MTQKPCENDTDEDIDRIFTYFDDENKGYISEEDLMRAAEELHEDLTPAEAKDMIKKCDPKGKGVIRPDAFLSFNKRRTFS